MEYPISPWVENGTFEVYSPNKLHKVMFSYECEVCQGGPLLGDVKIDDDIIFKACNPSLIWSDDSKFLAIPQWTSGKKNKLIVLDIENNKSCYYDRVFFVLQLEKFNNGVISGIDSPIALSRSVEILVKDLNWDKEVIINPFDYTFKQQRRNLFKKVKQFLKYK